MSLVADADFTWPEVLRLIEGVVVFGVAIYFTVVLRRIEVRRAARAADREEEEDARRIKKEERDATIEELRGLLEEAKSEAREARRDLKKGQEATAKRIAEIQQAHHECEKRTAAQDVKLTHFDELLTKARAELAEALDQIEHLTTGDSRGEPSAEGGGG